MKKYWIILFVLYLTGCHRESDLCIIEGVLPGKEYDGEKLYLVPVKNAVTARVDSTYIGEAAFLFEKKVKRNGIFIIRSRPAVRITLQELLIVAEPGRLHVELDSVSSAKGTPLNDALQVWKEHKMRADEERASLNRLLRIANDSVHTREIQAQIERVSADYSSYNYTFVKENRDNIVGEFVYKMIKHALTPEQKQELSMTDGN